MLGTATFGGQVDEAEALAMVSRSLDGGVTAFDTAGSYHDGVSEAILGRALMRLGADDASIVAKIGSPRSLQGEAGLSPIAVRTAIENSLRRLGRERIDLCILHIPDPETPLEDTLEALGTAVAEGKVLAVGHSNYASWQAARLDAFAQFGSWPKPSASQQLYNLLARRLESEFVPASRVLGLLLMAYNPLAGGMLTGKYLNRSSPPSEGRFTLADYRERYWCRENQIAVQRLSGIAQRASMTLIDLSYRWLYMQEHVNTVVIGASSDRQLASNLAAIDKVEKLDTETLRLCDEVWQDLRGPAPDYFR